MKLSFRTTRRILGGSALVVAAALLPGTALASTAAPARATWFAPRCATSQTLIWLGLGNGGGAAGTIFYPLEFTKACHGNKSVLVVGPVQPGVGIP
jgi:hypothetical protein